MRPWFSVRPPGYCSLDKALFVLYREGPKSVSFPGGKGGEHHLLEPTDRPAAAAVVTTQAAGTRTRPLPFLRAGEEKEGAR
jgi:hypothetical protein